MELKGKAIGHPDGWFLVLPTYALPLLDILLVEEGKSFVNIRDAVEYIGGCVYTEQEALASQRGEEAYRMDRMLPKDPLPVMPIPETEKKEETDTLLPQEGTGMVIPSPDSEGETAAESDSENSEEVNGQRKHKS